MKRCRKIVSMFVALVMTAAFFTGCGNSPTGDGVVTGDGSTNKTDSLQGVGQSDEDKKTTADSNAMGRYVETPADISDYTAGPKGITWLADGRVVIGDMYGRIVSDDNGDNWSFEDVELQTKLLNNTNYIMDIAYGADGTEGIIYTVHKSKTDEDGEGVEEDEDSDDADDMSTESLITKPDGTQIPVQITYEDDDYARNIWISKEGRIFLTTFKETIYEVKEDGMAEKYLTVDGRPEQVRFVDNLMVIDSGRFEVPVLYDMEKEEYVTDDVLNDFIAENYAARDYSTADTYDIFFFGGEDGALYIAGNKGLHRHVIGGSAIEQVIDGSLSSFSNPSNLIIGMTALPDNEFVTLFTGGKTVHYTYNPDIPTVPNERLKVYSLKENDTMRQAVNIYQTANPEVFVEYEIGIEGESSVTRDDALKKLNTQIMAGEGPDVLVLDNMPIDSYIGKNLLLDLSDCINEQELFGNIVDAFKTDGKLYMIPCEIQLPVIQGQQEDVAVMKDLNGIAGRIEELREENPGEPLLKIYSERGIMRLMSMICAPDWKTEDGKLDKEALKEFLTQCKRIYEAELDTIPEEYIVSYNDNNRGFSAFYGGMRESSDYFRMTDSISYLMGDRKVNIGTIYYPHGVCQDFSVNKVEGHEEDVIVPAEGMSKKVFIPKTLVGINAGSASIDRAKEMIKILLGSENQEGLFYGLSIHKDALIKSFEVDEKYISEEGIFSYIGTTTGDGRSLDLEVYVMEPEQLKTLQGWIEDAQTPYIEDTMIEDTVFTSGTAYIRGQRSLEEAVDEIEQNLAIYMSE